MKLKNGRWVTILHGIARFTDNPKPDDKIIGWKPNYGTCWRGLDKKGNLYYAMSLKDAVRIIVEKGWDEVEMVATHKKCECGSEKAGVGGHSSWCPKFD